MLIRFHTANSTYTIEADALPTEGEVMLTSERGSYDGMAVLVTLDPDAPLPVVGEVFRAYRDGEVFIRTTPVVQTAEVLDLPRFVVLGEN